ncbi:helix-turn-helix transcriptional regulator [Staphylococcus arlettae]|uniref:ArsR/SmtB family transcription factor n=1 Tax=Staphylococcus TaxID=1279 RepID=UPI0014385447|nr:MULTISPECIES: metalloregulator ArsR/SmtB family transcription factor [Staphylococcus]NKE85927.1 helix-turn-helix transcriptional regulator [Staphylococcus arlettae]URN39307.1 metalloregulator ArsR/SmtB family transcription factor [Staphylococcus arlettae]HAP2020308.1 helix-turn-helix transcriptional regulator [Escherichia coli]
MSSNKICDVICVHEGKVDNAMSFLQEAKPQHLIDTLLKISDENKLKIILALIKEQELCVCDLSITLGLSIATTSHHLRTLYKRGVLNFYKEGKMAYYYIKDIEMKSLLMKCLD